MDTTDPSHHTVAPSSPRVALAVLSFLNNFAKKASCVGILCGCEALLGMTQAGASPRALGTCGVNGERRQACFHTLSFCVSDMFLFHHSDVVRLRDN